MEYVAVLTRERSNILVTFPDCPGCQTFGRSRDNAITRAADALEGWLEAHLVSGDAPPRPRRRRMKRQDRSDTVAVPVSPILAVRLQLRWARQDLGLTQAQLAERVGVTRQQIGLLESPDANVTLRTLERVARAMGLRLDIQLSPNHAAA
ncbi:MAG TPA: type II toxin-antitoxin system HicB family antitoxin [Gemmatimonadaceae bacterium]